MAQMQDETQTTRSNVLSRTVCVFAGSSCGSHPDYSEAARALGRALVQRNCRLVYGGGRTGLMGELADTVLAMGGTVVGVIPERLATSELAHRGVTQLEIVATMHERKQTMADLAQAFIALPGGIGTFEEVLEALTWTQLRIHRKPVALYNARNYYGGLLSFLDHATAEQFMRPSCRALLLVEDDPERLLLNLERWIDPLGDGFEQKIDAST